MTTNPIETMATAICERRNAGDWPCNGLDFDTEMARSAYAAYRETDEYKGLVSERDGAYGYASRLFKHLAPQCEPLPTTLGVLTQLDNYIAGIEAEVKALREERDFYKAAYKESVAGIPPKQGGAEFGVKEPADE